MNRDSALGLALASVLVVTGLVASCQQQPSFPISMNAYAVDGDTFHNGDRTRYRIASIDAPELPGHCRPGRACAPGDPFASKAALQQQLTAGGTCTITGIDVYQRPLVVCTVGGRDLGGYLIAHGFAQPYIYRGHHD